ncbi:DUF6952 family protein [Cognataquiflexum rubidum]|uniref:DUF6952 family protein n=1 Tax=Cognataquiflexum rubidum TaxID=2922273 RepID=UPI001F14684A|nr:hypothetical protein [Cognataquiflexum rubidum]MCH6236013.1 hypothetical protein [Cognataquiflexum rubidum]
MRLPLIKHIVSFSDKNDTEHITETISMLEHIAEAKGIKDEELDTIGELLSNMYGAIEVQNMVKEGMPLRDALNSFMKRVTGSIDT